MLACAWQWQLGDHVKSGKHGMLLSNTDPINKQRVGFGNKQNTQ